MRIARYGFLALALFSAAMLSAQAKHALVIGNGAYAYASLPKLNNSVNDANDMKTALEGLGFSVDRLVNAGRVQMEEAVER
ncbi:MAG: caspase family protein, partial [Spirochaetia bacterium]|nr:caspase family protein [Spirochaetia bacterium]